MRVVKSKFLLPALFGGFLVFSALADNGASNGLMTITLPDSTKSTQDTLRAFIQIQEQLRATQMAITRNQEAAEAEAARNAEALSNRLAAIEQFMAAQRESDQEVMRNNNKTMLTAAGVFAVLGFIGMVFASWLQWRASNRLTEMTAASHMTRALLPGWPQLAPPGESQPGLPGLPAPLPVADRMLDLLEQLEKRIKTLEHTASPAIEASNTETATNGNGNGNGTADMFPHATSDTTSRITLLVGKGQSLLSMDQLDEAVQCFDEVLAIDGNNTDALVKKGVALERQRKLDAAIECYDRAIAADNSITIAYLYKGGIYNRLERFSEALECYEKALHTQEKQHA